MEDETKESNVAKNNSDIEIDQTTRCLPGQGPGAKFTLTGALSPDSMEAPKHDLFKNINQES